MLGTCLSYVTTTGPPIYATTQSVRPRGALRSSPRLWPPDGTGALGLLPRASNPAVTSDARQGGDRPQAQAQDYAVDIGRPSVPRVHSYCATSCRNHRS